MLRCVACGGQHLTTVFVATNPRSFGRKTYYFARCLECGLIFIDPMPEAEELARVYSYSELTESLEALNPLLSAALSSSLLRGMLATTGRFVVESRVKFLKRSCGSGKKVLDVGCGTGLFGQLASETGFDVWGQEISQGMADEAKKRLDSSHVIVGELSEFSFEKEFDAVTLWHVFEHMPDPETALGQIHRILKDDGVLILEVPSAKSLSLRLFRSSYTGLLVPEHLFFWSENSLRRILERQGFVIVSAAYPMAFPFTFSTSCARFWSDRVSGNTIKKLLSWSAFGLSSPFSLLNALIGVAAGTGEILRISARKRMVGRGQ